MHENLEIKPTTNLQDIFKDHKDELCKIGADAFKRGEDFYDDVEDHFKSASIGQLILHDGQISGFALYNLLPDNGIFLEGIAIKTELQRKNIGTIAVEAAIRANNIDYIAAATRNPATVKLIGRVASYSCPDIRRDRPFWRYDDEQVQSAYSYVLPHLNKEIDENSPYLIDRYPADLYGKDPGSDMPLAKISENQRNGVAIVGII